MENLTIKEIKILMDYYNISYDISLEKILSKKKAKKGKTLFLKKVDKETHKKGFLQQGEEINQQTLEKSYKTSIDLNQDTLQNIKLSKNINFIFKNLKKIDLVKIFILPDNKEFNNLLKYLNDEIYTDFMYVLFKDNKTDTFKLAITLYIPKIYLGHGVIANELYKKNSDINIIISGHIFINKNHCYYNTFSGLYYEYILSNIPIDKRKDFSKKYSLKFSKMINNILPKCKFINNEQDQTMDIFNINIFQKILKENKISPENVIISEKYFLNEKPDNFQKIYNNDIKTEKQKVEEESEKAKYIYKKNKKKYDNINYDIENIKEINKLYNNLFNKNIRLNKKSFPTVVNKLKNTINDIKSNI